MEEEGGGYENQLLGPNGMPLGFRFHPTDQELITFLYNRVLHGEYCENLIYELDLFGKTPPWVVWQNFGGPGLEDQDLYFFCQLNTRSQTRIKREIEAGGTWSESNSKPVKDLQNEKAIGKKRNLRYEKEGCEHDGDYLLEEYSILPSVVGGADDSDHKIGKVVLCRLQKNSRSAPVLPFDESNYKMISDTINHDQQCISNIDGSTMPAKFSDHDYVRISLISDGDESLLKDEDLLFDYGEDMFLDLDDLSTPLD